MTEKKTDDRVRLLDRFVERGFVALVIGMVDETSTETPKALRNINGYLAVPVGHAWHGKDYDGIDGVDVHGGLTFSGVVDHATWVREMLPDLDGWGLVGFDCAHAGDLTRCEAIDKSDNRLLRGMKRGDVWRDEDYVRAELRKLATQAADVDGPSLGDAA